MPLTAHPRYRRASQHGVSGLVDRDQPGCRQARTLTFWFRWARMARRERRIQDQGEAALGTGRAFAALAPGARRGYDASAMPQGGRVECLRAPDSDEQTLREEKSRAPRRMSDENRTRVSAGGLGGADLGPLARGGVRSNLRRSSSAKPTPLTRPSSERFSEQQLPGVLQGVRRPADLGPLLAHHPGHQQPAVLEVVRRGPAQRLLQLRRPPPGDPAQPGRRDLGAGAESEPTQAITYRDLYRRVNEFAALLRDFCGLKTGDRVTFHLPMVPDLPVAMLACARLGVIHSEVFGGFSGNACGERIADSRSRFLITMDGYYRNGELRRPQGQGRRGAGQGGRAGPEGRQGPGVPASRRRVRVQDPDGRGPRLLRRRDHRPYHRAIVVHPVSMPAEAPLFLMYTSGTTGQPKGAQHSTGGYLAYVTGTSKYYQDIHPEDTYWCMADIGWIIGHSYIVYGPLALGTTSVIYEGVPTYPDAGRPWRIAERLGVTIFHTAADLDPDAAQAGPGRAGQVRLPLQAHDHGRRADRARRLALVPRRRWASVRR